MFHPGLVSVTFRPLSPREIVNLCLENELQGIEWGGDVHVPPGDWKTAREVGKLTREAGLEVACYGSYFRCDGEDFAPILDSALALEAPLIRVWAGKEPSHEMGDDYYDLIAANLRQICEMAAHENIRIATEYHGNTLTDTRESCRRLHKMVAHPNLFSLWQPLRRAQNFEPKIEENLEDLRDVAPFLSNLHVYEWAEDENNQRQALSLENGAQWPQYLEELRKIGGDRFLMLEFVPTGQPEALPKEAAALRALLADSD